MNDVSNDARFVIKLSAALDSEILGHRNLHVLYVVAVEDRLQKGVGKPEVQNILDRLFPQIVVDSKNTLLGEHLPQHPVELAGRFQIPSKWFFHNHSGILCAAGSMQLAHHVGKEARGNRQVMHGATGTSEFGL